MDLMRCCQLLSDRGKSIMDKSQENNLLSSEALRLQVDSRTIIDSILTAILIASVITGVSIFVINRRIHRLIIATHKMMMDKRRVHTDSKFKNRVELSKQIDGVYAGLGLLERDSRRW
jgi:hypothetical protein